MSIPEAATPETTSSDYSARYYLHYDPVGGEYAWETEHWRNFFLGVADRIVGALAPTTALDVGCARGILVQALVARGVDARGFDISEDAISGAHPDVRDRLRVGSATEPIEGRYDVVTCCEVLEHMEPRDAQKAIDAMCAATDTVLFSSCPNDYEESTHVNTNPTAQWAAWFAERGFFRRVDVDSTFLAPWAIVFQRAELAPRALVERYEARMEPMRNEVIEKRRALLDLQRRYDEVEGPADEASEYDTIRAEVEIDDDALLARHAALSARDHVIGLEASQVRLQRELEAARKRNRDLRDALDDKEDELEKLHASKAWRVGRAVTYPTRRGRD
ncbi:methyltransferase domain-containing protein [Nocardioides mangrovicus]|uniref:Methyltransferase domain-containing protein n=2 Tax=Nocardioides mangrovicus TaxID=2478913 RepID=A0A3L8P508_9ACTN|nr:methyltransferase domain-containing protein [Nocardioides mangrovicus]